jgi:hypothetical protein
MMALHTDYFFANGGWTKSEAPQWFSNAVTRDGDWGEELSRAGATLLEEFGGAGADTIAIYQGQAGDYAILFWDAAKCIARVFIDNVPDYMTFRASIIAPHAMLIMESERLFVLGRTRPELRAVG